MTILINLLHRQYIFAGAITLLYPRRTMQNIHRHFNLTPTISSNSFSITEGYYTGSPIPLFLPLLIHYSFHYSFHSVLITDYYFTTTPLFSTHFLSFQSLFLSPLLSLPHKSSSTVCTQITTSAIDLPLSPHNVAPTPGRLELVSIMSNSVTMTSHEHATPDFFHFGLSCSVIVPYRSRFLCPCLYYLGGNYSNPHRLPSSQSLICFQFPLNCSFIAVTDSIPSSTLARSRTYAVQCTPKITKNFFSRSPTPGFVTISPYRFVRVQKQNDDITQV